MEAPILFIAGEKDELCPLKTVQEAAAKAPNARLSTHQGAHFDLYLAETLKVSCIQWKYLTCVPHGDFHNMEYDL